MLSPVKGPPSSWLRLGAVGPVRFLYFSKGRIFNSPCTVGQQREGAALSLPRVFVTNIPHLDILNGSQEHLFIRVVASTCIAKHSAKITSCQSSESTYFLNRGPSTVSLIKVLDTSRKIPGRVCLNDVYLSEQFLNLF